MASILSFEVCLRDSTNNISVNLRNKYNQVNSNQNAYIYIEPYV